MVAARPLPATHTAHRTPYGDTEEGLLRWMRELGEKKPQQKSEAHDGE